MVDGEGGSWFSMRHEGLYCFRLVDPLTVRDLSSTAQCPDGFFHQQHVVAMEIATLGTVSGERCSSIRDGAVIHTCY